MSHFDCSDAEGLDLDYCKLCGTAVVELLCNDGVCVECKDDAANSGEGDDMQDPDKLIPQPAIAVDVHEGFNRSLDTFMPYELTSMLGRILDELTHQETHANDTIKQVAAARLAVANHGKPPKPVRATRKDAGRPRAPKAANDVPRDEKGMAV